MTSFSLDVISPSQANRLRKVTLSSGSYFDISSHATTYLIRFSLVYFWYY